VKLLINLLYGFVTDDCITNFSRNPIQISSDSEIDAGFGIATSSVSIGLNANQNIFVCICQVDKRTTTVTL
jgi:hypothetical protein